MEIKEGSYYKDKKYMVLVTSIAESGLAQVLGFNMVGDFGAFQSHIKVIAQDCDIMTESAFKKALEAEVIRRGYTDSADVKSIFSHKYHNIGNSSFKRDGLVVEGAAIFINGIAIFHEGKWSEIRPQVNWDEPSKYAYQGEGTYVVQSMGVHRSEGFSAIVICSENYSIKEGFYTDSFNKADFKRIDNQVYFKEL